MRKLLVIGLCTLLLTGCVKKAQFGAIRISTNQPASVQIDGKDVGTTPYSSEKVSPGEVSLRVSPQDTSLAPWEALVDVTNGVWTIVNRSFATSQAQAEGDILTMQPISQTIAAMAVVSDPDGAMVKFDGQALGPTPLEKNQVDAGNHQITVSAPGYKERSIAVQTMNGYKVVINVKLAKVEVAPIQDVTEATDSAEATGSAKLSGTPTPKVSGTVTPKPTTKASTTPTPKVSGTVTPKPTTSSDSKGTVKILSTPVGFLRVRAEASVSSEEITQVKPGETFPLLDESGGWYKIELDDGTTGWVAGQYADKI